MADDGLLHTAELLKTALPYVDSGIKSTLDLLLKLFELIVCLRNFKSNDIAACDFDKDEKADMETLLNKVRPKCNEQEGVYIDKMLSVFQAKRMFEMYNSYMEVMNTMQGFEGFNKEGTNDSDVNNFMNNFSGFDFSGIDLSSIFGGNGEDNYNDKSDFEDSSNYNDVSNHEDTIDYYDVSNHKDATDYDDVSNHEDTTDYDEVSNHDKLLSHDEASNHDDKSNNNNMDYVDNSDDTAKSFNDNSHMFESLKSMITPDQMGAFEKLRMLFDSPSYYDNSKSDENKE